MNDRWYDTTTAKNMIGLEVRTKRILINHWGEIPVGTTFKIAGKLSGLELVQDPGCRCCGLKVRLVKVPPQLVELVPDRADYPAAAKVSRAEATTHRLQDDNPDWTWCGLKALASDVGKTPADWPVGVAPPSATVDCADCRHRILINDPVRKPPKEPPPVDPRIHH